MENKKIYRSTKNRVIAGVCGGIAEYFNLDPTLVRLIVALLTLASVGTGIVAYIVAALIMPDESQIR